MFCYSNNGNSIRAVSDDYTAQAGEVVFDHLASESELEAVFPGRPDEQLQAAKAGQVASIYVAYQNAIAQNVAYTTKDGVVQTYQADPVSIGYVNSMLSAYESARATPSGFYWIAADNTQVPFTYADLQGLAAAMGDQGWAAFQKLQGYKAQIKAARNIPDVQDITWS